MTKIEYFSTGEIVSGLIENYENITENEKKELISIANNPEQAVFVAEVLEYRYYSLPADFRNELLANIFRRDSTAKAISRMIYEFFAKIPPDLRNTLLKEVYDYPAGNFYKYKVLKFHFHSLPVDLREELLIKTAKMSNVSRFIPKFIVPYLKSISGESLGEIFLSLLQDRQGVKMASDIIRDYFYLFPESYRSKILFSLLAIPDRVPRVAYIIGKYFDHLPLADAEVILRKLYLDQRCTWGMVGLLVNFFEKIDEEIRNYLLKSICQNQQTKSPARFIIENNYAKIPPLLLIELEKTLQEN